MKKTLLFGLPLLALAIFLGFGSQTRAQNNQSPAQTQPPRWGMMAGLGNKWEIKAQILGITQAELKNQLQNGKTFAQILQEKGLSLEQFHAKMLAEAQIRLEAMVRSGQLTQQQADQRLEWMKTKQQNCGGLMGWHKGFGKGRLNVSPPPVAN